MELTWIVVADSSHARIFQLRDGQLPAEEIEDLANPLGRADNKQVASDSHGQFAGPDGHGHTAPRVEEPVQHGVRQFAREIARHLDTAAARQRFQQLALVAAPRFLGLLRESLDKQTRKLVTSELAKNVAALPRSELDACLQALARPRTAH
jgi:protein required for attachment to host cells